MKYPLPTFHFQVDWKGETMEFAEVSGLVMERQSIEYRHGLMKDQTGHMMPGIPKYSNITLKRGMTARLIQLSKLHSLFSTGIIHRSN